MNDSGSSRISNPNCAQNITYFFPFLFIFNQGILYRITFNFVQADQGAKRIDP